MLIIQENIAFIQLLNYQSQSPPRSNEQVMKTKLHSFTFACHQILCKLTYKETCEN